MRKAGIWLLCLSAEPWQSCRVMEAFGKFHLLHGGKGVGLKLQPGNGIRSHESRPVASPPQYHEIPETR